jgi:RNA polymerase sigma-70 factor (ECF subfamily)
MTDKTDPRGRLEPLELLARAQAGDPTAFADLVRQYRGLVFAVCFQQTGSFDDSEELTQEVFVAALRGLATLREPDKLAAWLQGIALNQSRMHRRRAGSGKLVSLDQEAAFQPDTSAGRGLELQHLLHDALQGITAQSREVLTLHYLGGYSYQEITALCKLPLRTVRSRLHEARGQLKVRLLEMVAELCRCSRDREHTTRCVLERCGEEPCACISRLAAD